MLTVLSELSVYMLHHTQTAPIMTQLLTVLSVCFVSLHASSHANCTSYDTVADSFVSLFCQFTCFIACKLHQLWHSCWQFCQSVLSVYMLHHTQTVPVMTVSIWHRICNSRLIISRDGSIFAWLSLWSFDMRKRINYLSEFIELIDWIRFLLYCCRQSGKITKLCESVCIYIDLYMLHFCT